MFRKRIKYLDYFFFIKQIVFLEFKLYLGAMYFMNPYKIHSDLAPALYSVIQHYPALSAVSSIIQCYPHYPKLSSVIHIIQRYIKLDNSRSEFL